MLAISSAATATALPPIGVNSGTGKRLSSSSSGKNAVYVQYFDRVRPVQYEGVLVYQPVLLHDGDVDGRARVHPRHHNGVFGQSVGYGTTGHEIPAVKADPFHSPIVGIRDRFQYPVEIRTVILDQSRRLRKVWCFTSTALPRRLNFRLPRPGKAFC